MRVKDLCRNPIKYPLPNVVKKRNDTDRSDAKFANICLNCKKKKCRGTCSEYERKIKEVNDV